MQNAFAYADGREMQWPPAISVLRDFVQSELPKLNNAIENRISKPDALVNRVRPLLWAVAELVTAFPNYLNRDSARHILQIVGFCIGSVERHLQASGEMPGAGKELLAVKDELLLLLGSVGRHPPRDSDTTYWYLNQACSLSFTGDAQEAHFNRVVNLQRQVQSSACDLLRPICDGEVEVSSTIGAQLMNAAAENLERLIEGYRSFTEPVDGGYRFSPDFFMKRMRTYLVTYPIAGSSWSGPNAANLTANMSLDYLTGLAAADYVNVVRGRWPYLVEEDQRELDADMARQSLTARVVHKIGVDADTVIDSDTEKLATLIATQPTTVQTMLAAFAAVVKPVGHATGIHFRLIHEYLIRKSQSLTAEDYAALPVKPDKGTGDMPHAQTKNIMDMRRKHPVVSKLLAAVRLVEAANKPNPKGA